MQTLYFVLLVLFTVLSVRTTGEWVFYVYLMAAAACGWVVFCNIVNGILKALAGKK